MKKYKIFNVSFQLIFFLKITSATIDYPDYPEGYFPFEQNPVKNPPKVRKPPYTQSNQLCPGVLEAKEVAAQSLKNLCGNLNEGYLPLNPIGQKVAGEAYPFAVIKNVTLNFFSKTLPILKVDKTLPRVAKYMHPNDEFRKNLRNKKRRTFPTEEKRRNSVYRNNRLSRRRYQRSTDSVLDSSEQQREVNFRRSRQLLLNSPELNEDTKRRVLQEHFALKKATEQGRSAKSFCQNNLGILCMIYNTFMSKTRGSRAEDRRQRLPLEKSGGQEANLEDGTLRPLTPCPSSVEYVTPVFARNYQGVWRYVVQIPYEGYFTQTIEITQCLSTKCHYLSGSCLSSPRWISLLVAEIFYPDVLFPKTQRFSDLEAPMTKDRPPPASKRGNFAQQRSTKEHPSHCDGVDDIGCYQVRLYYDWFLVPGSCKCWKQDFYAKFALKNN